MGYEGEADPVKYLSLFSGIEAATVAWHPLGWEPLAFAEIDPFPCAVLKHHYPDVPNLGDDDRSLRGETECYQSEADKMIKKKEVDPVTINGPDGTPLVTIPKYIVSGDIVELLRSLDDRDMHWDRIVDKAADEIERLRQQVKAANAVTEEHYAEIERLRMDLFDAIQTSENERAEIERLRSENNVLASLLACWLDPMLQGDDRWAISAETLEQLVDATKKVLAERQA